MENYQCNQFRALTSFDYNKKQSHNTLGNPPRVYLEYCIEQIEKHERDIQAFVTLQANDARNQAYKSTIRWRTGRQLSSIDDMPIRIKDLIETEDMPTEMRCEAFKGNSPGNDNPLVWALRQAGCVILGKTVTTELGDAHPGPTKTHLI